MHKTLKLSSDSGDFGRKKCKRGYSGAYCGVWREVGICTGSLLYGDASGGNLACHRADVLHI
jgi:hypothetical protein